MRCRPSTGDSAAYSRNGSSASASGQAMTASVDQHRAGHQHRDEGRGDGMGEEILDRLDVLRRQRDQVAGAPAQQIGRRQRIQLAEQVDAHLGQQRDRPCRARATIPASAAARPAAPPTSSATTSSSVGVPSRTAAMTSAPSTPTPMKATTRPMPQHT